MAQRVLKVCKNCGRQFYGGVRQAFCRQEKEVVCRICGNTFKVMCESSYTRQTCSKECDAEFKKRRTEEIMMKKYGVKNAMQIPDVREKIKQTNLEKYGTEWYTQTQEYRDSVKETCLKKYGTEHHLSAQSVIDKRVETVRDKYGVDNVFQSEEIKEKAKATNLEKFGVEYITQSEEIREKIVENNLKRYGVEYPSMLPEVQEKTKQTNISRYGVNYYTQQHIPNLTNWYEFIRNPRQYIEEHYSSAPSSIQLSQDLGVDISTIDIYLGKGDAFDCIKRLKSRMELELVQFIHSLDENIRIVQNSKSVIAPMELDLYLPDYRLAIECNPTCTHQSSIMDPWGNEPISSNYHKKKTDMCEKESIFLFHIFGYEWTHKQEIIKSMLRNLLCINSNKIYARKCIIKEVEPAIAKVFLNENHRQGAANSKIRLGLYYEDKLVSLMTFGKMRSTIGKGNEDLEDCYELVRFCSLLNTNVVGGASKLFKYFVRNYQLKTIRSFSDRAHTKGNLYSNLGFKEIRRSEPGYVWVDLWADTAYHRMNAQKHLIKNFLKDDNIDLNKSEVQIMTEHNFVQVFDSGTILWEWQESL